MSLFIQRVNSRRTPSFCSTLIGRGGERPITAQDFLDAHFFFVDFKPNFGDEIGKNLSEKGSKLVKTESDGHAPGE